MYTHLLVLFLMISSTASITVYVDDSSPLSSNSSSCGDLTEPCETLDLGLDVIQHQRQLNPSTFFELMIADGDYDHFNATNGVFKNVNGITITGQSSFEEMNITTVTCIDDSGFSFINSSNIIISGIKFIGCGQLQNSTSYNDTSFSMFYVGLYFLYCRDVNLTDISVTDSHATGIVLYNIIGTNILHTVTVSNNTFTTEKEGVEGSGGGVYIEYSYCVPYSEESDIINCLSKGMSNVDKGYTNNSEFLITDSLFSDNIANISDTISNSFILPSKQFHTAFGRGGGLSIFFKGNASYNTITVDSCTFKNNRALWGAGLFVEYQDSTFNNSFSIRDSNLSNNNLHFNEGTGGGGARVGYISFDRAHSHSNEIVFENCMFHDNSAHYGGGLSFYSSRQPLIDKNHLLNVLKFLECHFDSNSGRIGAGLDISVWHISITGKHPHCLIEDTVFTNNNPVHPSNGGLVGIGAVYVDSIPTVLRGQVTFKNNSGSALVVTGSYVTISRGAIVNFTSNIGRNGGAIALLDNTFIVTSEGSSLYFINNSALYKGGAIYSFRSGERDLISSGSCFLRYENISIVPKEWNVRFVFQNNTIQLEPDSVKYNAIYATSLLPCIWGGSYGNATYDARSNGVFCWDKSRWAYDENTTCERQILSSPKIHKDESVYSNKPGQPFSLNISLQDELGHSVNKEATIIARIINGKATFRGNSLFTYISHEHLQVYGEQNTNIRIQLETLDPIVTRSIITVQLKHCAPGFDPIPNEGCVCHSDEAMFSNKLQCNQNNFTSKVIYTAWMGESENKLLAGHNYFFHKYNDFILNGDDNLNEAFCGSTRTGTLCGLCRPGFGLTISGKCVKCTGQKYNWLLYILSTYLPITIFFIIVFSFSMVVTSGPLVAFVFFSQVITTVIEVDAKGMIPLQNATSVTGYKVLRNIYTIPYSIWNLDFIEILTGDFCLNQSFNMLDVMLLGYGEALYPLILLLLIIGVMALYNKGIRWIVWLLRPLHYCFARFQQWTNLRQSVTGGIAVFIVISYTKFTLISLQILVWSNLYDIDSSRVKTVHYFDGNIEYPSKKYVIPAIIVLATFGLIPPLLLIYPSLLRLVERLSCWRLKLTKLYPFPKLAMFMDEFYGCYKDGRNGKLDCRWFAGLYFILRMSLFTTYTVTNSLEAQYLTQILLFLLFAFLIAFIRPYHIGWINNVDYGFFLLLAAISALSLFNLMKTKIDEALNLWAFSIQYILILIPLLYCIGYYLVFICKRSSGTFKRYIATKSHKMKIPENLEDSHGYQNALVGSTHVPNIMEYIGANSQMRLTRSTTWRGTDETAPLIAPQNRNNYEAIIEDDKKSDDQ